MAPVLELFKLLSREWCRIYSLIILISWTYFLNDWNYSIKKCIWLLEVSCFGSLATCLFWWTTTGSFLSFSRLIFFINFSSLWILFFILLFYGTFVSLFSTTTFIYFFITFFASWLFRLLSILFSCDLPPRVRLILSSILFLD